MKNCNTMSAVFSKLEKALKGTLTQNENDYTLSISNAYLNGTIRGVTITDNQSFIAFDLKCIQSITLNLGVFTNDPLHFLYSSMGVVSQSFGTSENKTLLKEYQMVIAAGREQDLKLHFTKDNVVDIVLLTLSSTATKNQKKTSFESEIHQLFLPNTSADTFLYSSSFNLKIAEQIANLKKIEQNGLVKKLLIESAMKKVLAMEIQHYQDDLEKNKNSFGALTIGECNAVKTLAEKITAHPEEQYSVEQLSRESGLSAIKLQEGFKSIYGRTVGDYIKNIRLELAERLIREGELNISEVVYTIGFSSRSYFSKIFKERYHCTPSYYLSGTRAGVVNA